MKRRQFIQGVLSLVTAPFIPNGLKAETEVISGITEVSFELDAWSPGAAFNIGDIIKIGEEIGCITGYTGNTMHILTVSDSDDMSISVVQESSVNSLPDWPFRECPGE